MQCGTLAPREYNTARRMGLLAMQVIRHPENEMA